MPRLQRKVRMERAALSQQARNANRLKLNAERIAREAADREATQRAADAAHNRYHGVKPVEVG